MNDSGKMTHAVTDEDVERACREQFPETWNMHAENMKVSIRSTTRKMLQSFAASLPVAKVNLPDAKPTPTIHYKGDLVHECGYVSGWNAYRAHLLAQGHVRVREDKE